METAVINKMKTERIEFIDAMRGFTIILVVMCHVCVFCYGIENGIENGILSINSLLYEFRMPTFFFISGFVLYKAGRVWDFKYVLLFLKKKFPVQIITTLIFFSIFLYINGISLEEGIFDDAKQSYWFTYVLFIYYIVYSITQYLFYSLRFSEVAKNIAIISLGLIFYYLFFFNSVYYTLPFDSNIKSLLSMHHWGYFLFFTIGTIFKKYYTIIQHYFDEKPIILLCLLIYFGLNIFHEKMVYTHINIFNLLTSITGTILLFSFFQKNKSAFSKNKLIGRYLQYIGRRTLDIYLLHYFLLPTNLFAMTSFLRENPIPIIEFVITLTISLIVICGCLIVSSVLRMSPFATYILFGVKNKNSHEILNHYN